MEQDGDAAEVRRFPDIRELARADHHDPSPIQQPGIKPVIHALDNRDCGIGTFGR
jgi:hypothetical protein